MASDGSRLPEEEQLVCIADAPVCTCGGRSSVMPKTVADAVDHAASLDPSLPARFKGASAEEIDMLEKHVGAPLPPVHRAFLERLSESDGGFDSTAGCSTKVADLIDMYRLAAEDWREPLLPEGWVLFAVPPRDGRDDLVVLDAREPDRAPLHWSDGPGEPLRLLSDSLVGFLFRELYVSTANRAFAYRRRQWSGRLDPELPEVAAYARAQGFAPLWFSDAAVFCGERGGTASIAVAQFKRPGLSTLLRATTPAEADALAREFGARFRLEGFWL